MVGASEESAPTVVVKGIKLTEVRSRIRSGSCVFFPSVQPPTQSSVYSSLSSHKWRTASTNNRQRELSPHPVQTYSPENHPLRQKLPCDATISAHYIALIQITNHSEQQLPQRTEGGADAGIAVSNFHDTYIEETAKPSPLVPRPYSLGDAGGTCITGWSHQASPFPFHFVFSSPSQ